MRFIVFDLEATCWLGAPPNNVQEIIEIGAILLDSYGSELGSFNKFVRPKVNPNLSAYCQELTSITQEQVNRANDFSTVVEHFQDWAMIFQADYQLVHWGPADVQMLRNDCILHDLEYEWLLTHIDLKKQYSDLKRLKKQAGLKRALAIEGMEFTGTQHRAIDDAWNTAQIFLNHIDEWQF